MEASATANGKQNKVCVLTGFGKFAGIPENPTNKIVDHVLEEVGEENFFPDGTLIAQVLETSMVGVNDGLETLEACVSSLSEEQQENVVWIHLGVYAQQSQFRLEHQAFNEANFRVPDERGAQPSHQKIVEQDGTIRRARSTSIELDQFCGELHANGFTATAITSDPGRFICNYTYYLSLAKHRDVLFIHVPEFDVFDLEHQVEFVHKVVNSIHDFRICKLEVPSSLKISLEEMGFHPNAIKRAFLAVNQGANIDFVLGWLMENTSSGDPNMIKPLENFEQILRLRQSGLEEMKVVMVANAQLQMSAGKLASQVGHAALALNRQLAHGNPALMDQWVSCGEPLIVCKAKDQAEINQLIIKAEQDGVPCVSMCDAGRTEVAPGSMTVIAVGPAPISVIDGITGKLKLV